jgi:hypothetical protein
LVAHETSAAIKSVLPNKPQAFHSRPEGFELAKDLFQGTPIPAILLP